MNRIRIISNNLINKNKNKRFISYIKPNIPNPNDPYNSSKIIIFITISIIYKTFIDNNE